MPIHTRICYYFWESAGLMRINRWCMYDIFAYTSFTLYCHTILSNLSPTLLFSFPSKLDSWCEFLCSLRFKPLCTIQPTVDMKAAQMQTKIFTCVCITLTVRSFYTAHVKWQWTHSLCVHSSNFLLLALYTLADESINPNVSDLQICLDY